MSTLRVLSLFGLLLLAAAIPVQAIAADNSAKDFVTAIYRNYEGKEAKGLPLDSPANRALFTPGLMQLIDADLKQAAQRKEPPELDGDPFVDAQDWDIPSFTVDVADKGPTKAEATVHFANGGQENSVTLLLVKLNNAWRIDNIVWTEGSVREILTRKK
jgi:hypothetical protein